LDQDEIWQQYPKRKYVSIDRVEFLV